MEQRVGEADLVGDDADEDQPAGVADIVAGIAHGAGVAGGVEDHGGQTAGDVLEGGQLGTVPLRLDDVMDTHRGPAKVEAALVDVEDSQGGAGQAGEFEY